MSDQVGWRFGTPPSTQGNPDLYVLSCDGSGKTSRTSKPVLKLAAVALIVLSVHGFEPYTDLIGLGVHFDYPKPGQRPEYHNINPSQLPSCFA